MDNKKLAEKLAAIGALKAGVRTLVSYGQGPWIDVSQETLMRLKSDIVAEKRRHIALFEAGKITFRLGGDPKADTADVIASLKAEIAQLEFVDEVG